MIFGVLKVWVKQLELERPVQFGAPEEEALFAGETRQLQESAVVGSWKNALEHAGVFF